MIREIKKSDIHHCVEIVLQNWGHAPAQRFHEEVKHAFRPELNWPPEYFVYEHQGKVVAFAGMMPSWIMHNVWDFIWINVKKGHEGHSIGRKLTSHRMNEVARRGGAAINLITSEPGFFEKLGFHKVHEYIGGWVLMTIQFKELSL